METAAYGLKRALDEPEDERGATEKLLMTEAVFYIEAVSQRIMKGVKVLLVIPLMS